MEIIYTVCEYFLIFSFLGWCTEVAFQAASKGKIINRGFLNGPVCPIYGFGVLSVLFMLQLSEGSNFSEQNALEVFLFGMTLSTVVELLGGWLLDKAFHARWWDYSNKPFNFHGYICLEFSIIWGLAILIVVRAVYPMLSNSLSHLSHRVGWVLIVVFGIVSLADFIVSVSVMIGLNKRLAEIDEMQRRMRIVSDGLSEHIGERTLDTAQRVDEAKVQSALARSELDAKREELLKNIDRSGHFGAGRLLRAFPEMRHRRHQDIIESIRTYMDKRV